MADIDDSTSSGFDADSESGAEVYEDGDTELYVDEGEEELYDPGYDHNEYEEELMDFSYEAKDPASYSKENEAPKLNDKGEPVEDVPLYKDGNYLNYEHPDYVENGIHHANWPEGDGFEGETTETVLPENTVIARYGSENGRFGTDVGTNPEGLSLPYDTDTQEYHEYAVCGEVSCISGKASPAFDEKGGGNQYMFSKSFSEMVNDGTLKRLK